MTGDLTCTRPYVAASFPLDEVDLGRVEVTDSVELAALARRYRSIRAAVVVQCLRACLQPLGEELPRPERRAVVLGTATGAGPDIEHFLDDAVRAGDHLANPALFPSTVHNATAGHAAVAGQCRGPNIVLSAGPASVWAALEAAHAIMVDGSADLILAGGFESVRHADGTIGSVAALAAFCVDPTTPLPRRLPSATLPSLYRTRRFAAGLELGPAASTGADRSAVAGLIEFAELFAEPADPALLPDDTEASLVSSR